MTNQSDPNTSRRRISKTLLGNIARSKSYRIGRAVYPKCLGALSVADLPAEDALRTSRHLRLGDLALHDPNRVGLPPVLEGRVGPVLERLDEAAVEADGYRGTGQLSALSCSRSSSKGCSSSVSRDIS
jgi:hypothetical protein